MIKEFEVDVVGQYYAGTVTKKHRGEFSITVNLNEELNLAVLTQASRQLGEKFPFVVGKLCPTFFSYTYKIINKPLKPIPAGKKNDQLLIIFYGKNYFEVEVSHLLFDGRTLSKITRELTLLYFEILDGVEIKGIHEKFTPKSLEDSYKEYTGRMHVEVAEKSKEVNAYQPPFSPVAKTKTTHFRLSASLLKHEAKKHQVTISECLMALIFVSLKVERAHFKQDKPIISMIPIDIRRFFPSQTMRNFVGAVNITMKETDDFEVMLQQIHQDFKKINKANIYHDFAQHQQMIDKARFVPRKLIDLYMKKYQKIEAKYITIGLSNLGKIDLPVDITERLSSMNFNIALDEDSPYFFSCVSVGDVLTLSMSSKVDDAVLIKELKENFQTFYMGK
ncbi:MAG: hypothetical protein LBV67_05690 [Streptococcaceae bacterium]|jgi:hypothetical protein|nr:hypothetical protein [Streptococcaceae bacterium]